MYGRRTVAHTTNRTLRWTALRAGWRRPGRRQPRGGHPAPVGRTRFGRRRTPSCCGAWASSTAACGLARQRRL